MCDLEEMQDWDEIGVPADDDTIVSVLTEEQMKELKEFDEIFGDIKHSMTNKELHEAAEKFADACRKLGLTVMVITDDLAKQLNQAFAPKTDLHVLAEDLKSLQPPIKVPDDFRQRKGKGERKRASRQRRNQWRRK